MRWRDLRGQTIPAVGQGTWGFGVDRVRRKEEVEALREGFALGMTLVDTAEFYAGGEAERVVGEAIQGDRERVFLVLKVWPSHAGRDAFPRAVARSLRRLRTDYADAVLLHWPTRSVALSETLAAMRELRRAGVTRHIGFSNFSLPLLEALWQTTEEGEVSFEELPLSLCDRRAEGLIPEIARRGELFLAYSPLGHGRLSRTPGFSVVERIARRRGVSPFALALAFLLRHENVVVLPKATRLAHVRENAAAADLVLTEEEVAEIERAFPPASHAFSPALPPYLWFHRLAFFLLARGGLRDDGA